MQFKGVKNNQRIIRVKRQIKTPKENRYYDNPDTQMHVLLQFLFAKVGINIDALG